MNLLEEALTSKNLCVRTFDISSKTGRGQGCQHHTDQDTIHEESSHYLGRAPILIIDLCNAKRPWKVAIGKKHGRTDSIDVNRF